MEIWGFSSTKCTSCATDYPKLYPFDDRNPKMYRLDDRLSRLVSGLCVIFITLQFSYLAFFPAIGAKAYCLVSVLKADVLRC